MSRGFDTAARELVDAQFFATLEDLELIARVAVEGFLQGLHRSPYVGFSVEFASHREYLPGDDLRHLNWKLYGRQDKLYVKQYDAETNLDLHLLLDWSGSMTTASGKVSKQRYAQCLVAALAHLALMQRDAVGVTLFADGILEHIKPRAKSNQLEEILEALVSTPLRPHAESATVLHEVAELMPRRGLVVLVSDLFYPGEELFSGGVELEPILWFGKAMPFIWEEHIFVGNAFTLHGLYDLFRFRLFHARVVCSLRDEHRDFDLFDLEEWGARLQKFLFGIRVAYSFVQASQEG